MARITSSRLANRPSPRKFGGTFAILFALVAVYMLSRHQPGWGAAILVASGLTTFVTVFAPQRLEPLNKLWFELGVLLGKVVNPIVLGTLFFLVITPLALIMRLAGRDALLLKKRDAPSYWVNREPHGPTPESFKHLF